jgi:hypothetical protein
MVVFGEVTGGDNTGAIVGLLTAVSAGVLALIVSVVQAKRHERRLDLGRMLSRANGLIAANRKPRDRKVIEVAVDLHFAMEYAKDNGTLDSNTATACQERIQALFDILEDSARFGPRRDH